MKKELKMYEVPKIESLQDMVLQSARKYGPKIALEDLNDTPLKSLTYRELLDNILLFGSALKQLGLKERSHVALIGENRVQWSLSYLTLMCFNYVIVPIDKNLTTNEIMNIIHESDSEAIIFSGSFASIIADAKNSLKNLNHYICMDATKEDKEFNIMPEMIRKASPLDPSKMPIINPNDLAEIIFTSGSLGRAKGVMLSQRNLASNLMAMTMMINIVETDRFLSVLPIHHTYECTCGMLCPLFAGASAHYARSLSLPTSLHLSDSKNSRKKFFMNYTQSSAALFGCLLPAVLHRIQW